MNNNIIELNQNEISSVYGGSWFGNACGYAGALVGIFVASLEIIRQFNPQAYTKGSPQTGFTFYSSKNPNIIGTASLATLMTLGIVAAQTTSSFIFATVGNVVTEMGEAIFGKSK